MFKKGKIIAFIIFGLILVSIPGYADNTSIRQGEFIFEDITLTSSSFILDGIISFNTTDEVTNFAVFTAMNIQKTLGGGTSVITGRLLVDSVLIVEQDLITIGNLNEVGVAGFKPLNFSVAAGVHNLSIEFLRTGVGTIVIDDRDFEMLQDQSAHSRSIFFQMTNINYTHTETSPQNAFNWTMFKNKTSNTFITAQQTITKTTTGSSLITYFDRNNLSDTRSPLILRELANANAIGSTTLLNVGEETGLTHLHTIVASQTDAGAVVTSIGSVFNMDLRDNDSNTIGHFAVSNNETNGTITKSFTAGTHNIANVTVNITNGTGYLLAMTASTQSDSGTQVVTFFVNSTEISEDNCFSKKERFLGSNTAVRNSFIFTTCRNTTINENQTFNLFMIVETGETTILLDENFVGIEGTPFDISRITIPLTDTELLLDCLRDGNCDGWFIKERIENILLLIVYFTVLILAIKWSGGDQD